MKKSTFDPARPLSSRRRPPTTLSLGSTRWRVFGMVLAVFLVVKLADTVRDPKSWRWLTQLDDPQAAAVPPEEAPPDTRLPPTPSRVAFDPPGTFISVSDQTPPKLETPLAGPEHAGAARRPRDAFTTAWTEAWREIFPKLANDDRAVFFRALKASRDDKPLGEAFRKPLQALIALLDHTWTGYQAEATAALVTLNEKEQAAWLDVLRRLGSRWADELQPALQALAEGRSPSSEQAQTLADLQQLLDKVLLANVKDNTVWRAAETEIWFRQVERVQAWKPGHPDLAAPAEASYVQLFKQPEAYRGEVVKIHGLVREAYRVRAWDNWCGVEYYYVFVLKPDDVMAPIFIYALELPPGFPPVKDREKDRGVSSMNEEVTFTGVFFKRWAYPAKENNETAPLLLAKTGVWKPYISAFPKEITPESWQSLWTMIAVMFSVLSVVFLGVWFVQFRRRSAVTMQPGVAGELRALEQLPLGPTVKDQLRDLEERKQ